MILAAAVAVGWLLINLGMIAVAGVIAGVYTLCKRGWVWATRKHV